MFIGDVHGCLDEFEELINRLQVGPQDRVVCLGDFMDKGPHPAECVRFARELGVESVLGNHEEKHLRWRRHEDRRREQPGYKNPMRPFSERVAVQNAALSDEDVAWLRGLPWYLEALPGLVAVHGGLLPGRSLEQQDPSTMIRARWVSPQGKHVPTDYENPTPPGGTRHWVEVYDGHHNVVYGHEAHSLSTPRVDITAGGTCFGIDTGCVHGGRLTALVVDGAQHSFVQVQARQCYAEPHFPIPA